VVISDPVLQHEDDRMNDRARLLAASGAAGLVGAILAVFILTTDRPSASEGPSSAASVAQDGAPICNISSGGAEPTFYSEMSAASAHMHEAMELAPEGNVDRDFIRMMIPHHQGAIDMALVLLKHGHDERLKRLAQSIIVEQGQEVAYMRSLLESSDESAHHKSQREPGERP
jgi:Domain of unknown function (DUF305)